MYSFDGECKVKAGVVVSQDPEELEKISSSLPQGISYHGRKRAASL
jgi:hypothetical protein